MKALTVFFVICLLASVSWSKPDTLEKTLDAICMAESSGGKDKRDGDRGDAIGAFQIHKEYWQDACRIMGVHWPYKDARDMAKARAAVRAYITTYQKANGYPATPEVWCRLHNGGPKGPEKRSTRIYWNRVRGFMK